MQLTCPSCGARYRIDPAGWPLVPGANHDAPPAYRPRKVRCRACAHVWLAAPDDDILDLAEPIAAANPAIAAAWASVTGAPLPIVPAAAPAAAPAPPTVMSLPPPPRFHFEAPPVPVPAPSAASAPRGADGRARLPGPAAFVSTPAPPAAAPAPAAQAPGRPHPPVEPQREAIAALAAEARAWVEAQGPSADGREAYEDPDDRPRRWPAILAVLLVAALVWTALVITGRLDPTRLGLPPFDPSRVPFLGLAAMQAGLPAIALPSLDPAALSARLPAPPALPRVAPPPIGVEAEAVRRALGGGRGVWEVVATLTNPTATTQPVPPLELALLDRRGQPIERWTLRPEPRALSPGASVRIETTAIDPPRAAASVRVALKPAEPGRI